jgi:hypothetical protein
MSDGPHKSLPLRRHWQDLAQRMATPSFPSDQVWEVLPYALKREVLEAPIKEVRDIMSWSLFPELRAEQLEGLRPSCRGSAAANRLIDCAVEVTMSGLTGDAGTHSALRNALEDTACISLRGIEEHYQRNAGSRSAGYVRGRIDEARRRLDCDALASDLLSPSAPKSSRSITLPRRSGVDEGPPL